VDLTEGHAALGAAGGLVAGLRRRVAGVDLAEVLAPLLGITLFGHLLSGVDEPKKLACHGGCSSETAGGR
jgi:hypothetical protein